ncbi:hypothetical protein LOD99_5316 [Oopsacas minuta]|uniref:Uncharacterized protein n=1 Tax=Oopsacas minuta TaxID=111878 RepID=A0AAV7JS42_9METZ|nr:hypothetical protein LOD99_5316 [Oopsacas minuta]
MSNVKLKVGIFDCAQIRSPIRNTGFVQSMTNLESPARCAFVLVVNNFLGNNKANNYIDLVNDMIYKFKDLDVKIRIKVHYLFSHLDRFLENLGDLSEEQGERFHQVIKVIEERYQGRWGPT